MNSGLIPKIDSIDYFNYLFSFWTIIAGPIQRFNEFKDSFYAEKPLISDEQRLQFQHRAANGLIKILIFGAFFKDISDVALKYYVSYRGNPLELLSNMKCFIAIFYCYPLYLWFNFSGYCDVVIGMGKWAGFTIPENFNKPYLSRNLIEFWNRWHMTLSRWIRDFVYLQLFDFLGSSILSKHIFKAQYLSIFITFILVGIWHGTTKNFVVFGFLQGIGMAGSMYYRDILLKKFGKQRYERYIDNKKIAFIERFICIHYICFTLLFFM
jgi:D-alanyl-lipoteichoic acid acyltransferase DltB (MBOAT superfamily)